MFHLHTYPITRKQSQGSAVHAAAYRSGEALVQRSTVSGSARDIKRARKAGQDRAIRHDYSQRFGVVSAELIFPDAGDNAPECDRETLWNMAEAANTRSNSRMAREFRLALPHELSAEQRHDLATDFTQRLVDRYDMAADLAIHLPSQNGDQRNYHAHVQTTTNKWQNGEHCEKTELELSNADCAERGISSSAHQVQEIRQMAEHTINKHLALAGVEARVSCRSHAAQLIPVKTLRHYHIAELHHHGADAANENASVADGASAQIAINANYLRSNPAWLAGRCREGSGDINSRYLARSLAGYIPKSHVEFAEVFDALSKPSAPLENMAAAVQEIIKADVSSDVLLENQKLEPEPANELNQPLQFEAAEDFDPDGFVVKVEERLQPLCAPLFIALDDLRQDHRSISSSGRTALIQDVAECQYPDQIDEQTSAVLEAASEFEGLERRTVKAHPEVLALGKALREILDVVEQARSLSVKLLAAENSFVAHGEVSHEQPITAPRLAA